MDLHASDAIDIGLLSIDSLLWFVLVTRFQFFPEKIFWQFLKFHITAFGQKVIFLPNAGFTLQEFIFSTALSHSIVFDYYVIMSIFIGELSLLVLDLFSEVFGENPPLKSRCGQLVHSSLWNPPVNSKCQKVFDVVADCRQWLQLHHRTN